MSTATLPERSKYNGDHAETAGPLEVEASIVRHYLERCMREAPDGSRAKDEARAAFVAFACVSISARAGKDFTPGVARELGEAEARNTLFMQAVERAKDLWRQDGGDPDIGPDTGRLIYWLHGKVAQLSLELDKALQIRPVVVRMSEKFTGPVVPVSSVRVPDEDDPPPQPTEARKRVRKRS